MREQIDILREDFDSVPIPLELDMVIEKYFRKARKVKRRGRIIKPLVAAAVVIIAFVMTVNLSPAFASYLANLPVSRPGSDIISDGWHNENSRQENKCQGCSDCQG